MKYYTFAPSRKLAGVVRSFWVFEGTATPESPYIHRTLASSSPELIFHYEGVFNELLSDTKSDNSFLTGIHAQTNQFRRFIVKEKFGIFGVHLYPFALSTLFGIPAIELTNELPDLIMLLKKSDISLNEKIFEAKNNSERLAIITSFLEHKIKAFERPEIVYASKSILESKGQIDIKKLSESCNLSIRQFERKFKEQIGFTAKTFSRIVRFNSVIQNIDAYNGSLTEMAYHFGYYDQSHFIQDFKSFSGYNPGTYFTGKAMEVLK